MQADVPTPPAEEESQFQQITAARKYIAEQALKQQAKKVNCSADSPVGSNQCVPPVGMGLCMMQCAVLLAVRCNFCQRQQNSGQTQTDQQTDTCTHIQLASATFMQTSRAMLRSLVCAVHKLGTCQGHQLLTEQGHSFLFWNEELNCGWLLLACQLAAAAQMLAVAVNHNLWIDVSHAAFS